MKICFVVPTPVSYQRGGAENHYEGLSNYIRDYTEHESEVLGIASLEYTFWALIENYYKFFNLDVSQYDVVISFKYPAWMVDHSNHICHLIHTVRGLYDMYHFSNLPEELVEYPVELDEIMKIIRSTDYKRENFLLVYNLLLKNKDLIEASKLDIFPGPFIREIIHFFDKCGFQGVSRMACNSKTVRSRKEYYLPGKEPFAVYPAPFSNKFYCKDFDYFFTASRLEDSKRVNVVIEEFKKTKNDRKLLIAGKGPREHELNELASGDERIEFLGFVDNEELIDLYANSLAVIFTPYEEDYGYITIEAMKSKKPVLTLNDSGGVLEFVEDGETGFVCTKDNLYEKIDFLSDNPNEAIRMGKNAYEKVKNITWSNAYKKLFGFDEKKKKVLVVNTYFVSPPSSGGQVRLWNIYKRLAEKHNVTFLSVTGIDKGFEDKEIAFGFREVLIPENKVQAEKRWNLERKLGEGHFDVINIYNIDLNDDYRRWFKELSGVADVIVFTHPYMAKMYDFIENVEDKLVIYESHNVECLLRKDLHNNNRHSRALIEDLRDVERDLCSKVDFVLTVSENDKDYYHKEFDVSREKIHIISNGVDTKCMKFVEYDYKCELRKKAGIDKKVPICVFMGSWWPPNIESFRFILSIAKERPEYLFFVFGAVYKGFLHGGGKVEDISPNVKCFGIVDDDIKRKLLAMSDVALNPAFGGGGTNLKIFEYMSVGIPVVTTEFGARGLEVEEGRELFFAEAEDEFLKKIDFVVDNTDEVKALRELARKYVEENFSWDEIAQKYLSLVVTPGV